MLRTTEIKKAKGRLHASLLPLNILLYPKHDGINFRRTDHAIGFLQLFAVPIKALINPLLAPFGRCIAFITTKPYPKVLTL